MRVLFLYTELAEYFLKCCEELSKVAEVHIIRWPVNKEAPFEFEFPGKIKIYSKNDYNYEELQKLMQNIQPEMIICSGWIDKEYLKLTKPYFKKIPSVLTCDTHGKGSLKQYLALALSRFFLLRIFSDAWVPGEPQKTYVKKLGFKTKNIQLGFYSCDLPKFNTIYEEQKVLKKNAFPKRFIYVGRYYDFKGVSELWQAFMELQKDEPNEWELWCLGTGSVPPVNHPKIKHFGFVQPKDLAPILKGCGVFILPSRFEPWGVVVQEMSAAGFPLLLSRAVGAKEAFLIENTNGYSFPANDSNSLKMQLKKIINLSAEELLKMSENSHAQAQKINPQTWVKSVLDIYHGFKN